MESPLEPIFTQPELPRYSQTPFPPYRYLPFQGDHPHPRNDPAGHSYGQEEEYLPAFNAADWPDCAPYLYGIDLFNSGYWWEAHESLEAVWLAAGRESIAGQFLQGLIQLAGTQIKRFTTVPRGAQHLTNSGCKRLQLAPDPYLGIEVAALVAEARRCLSEDRGEYPSIELHWPEG